MSDRVSIRVKADYQHDSARVGGMIFSKLQALMFVKDALSDDILRSEILDVQPYDDAKAQKINEKPVDEPKEEIGKAGVKPKTPKGG